MPFWSVLLIALGGLLIGGAWSLRQQQAPAWLQIGFMACAVLAIVAGFVTA